jgi:hypothetical protein
MSDIPSDWRGQLDLRAEIARIDRDHADIVKLQAEAKKFNRDPWILALAALIAMFGTVMAAIVARLPELLAAFGWAH